jgi:superfamily II RNA helicase
VTNVRNDAQECSESATLPSLGARVPPGGSREPDEILDRFLAWITDQGLEPFPHQEEALLELMADRHVVLGTPTGSGKSLVALGLHFKALCEGQRSFYTAPIKALVSEKFFALCDDFGPADVGMLTGDASINPDAPILCCTTEVLANMCLRQGERTDAPYVVMDEFHYYADRERGVSWQIPLLSLPDTRFLLMSATLGNTAVIEARLRERTGREVAGVFSDERPVPLDFDYREAPLHETIQDLLDAAKAPVYVVSFTQRECAERAQALTSVKVCSREEKRAIAAALAGFRFDTAYGGEFQRFVRSGIGVHHAGLLPKYRLLVERLAQAGHLKVICGTDTLGVGVNIPIRTVVFSKLCKFDGEKVAILGIREFKQIAGRAGRKGFDERGSVVAQAPEHVIENKRLAARAAEAGAKRRRVVKKKAPARGFVPWNRETFERLIARPPEMLESRFDVSHGMLVSVLQRQGVGDEPRGGYGALADLIARAHESPAAKARHRRRAAVLFRSLRRAGIVRTVRDAETGRRRVRVNEALQIDFSLHHTLSLFLVEAVSSLETEAPDYPLEVLSLVEAILENPQPILRAQTRKARDDLLARLKAEGVPYEDRIRQLEQVTHPQPEAEFIHAAFQDFATTHPWVRAESIHPKSVARAMFEDYRSFVETVREYGIARSEGVLLRYLSQVHNALLKTVPEAAQTQEVIDLIAYLRTLLQRVDSSLVEAWEALLHPAERPAEAAAAPLRFDLASQPRLLAARVRSELHGLVRALAARDFSEAAGCVRSDPDDPWDEGCFERALAPFFEEYDGIVFTPDARQSRRTLLKKTGPRTWDVSQVLVDPLGDELWAVQGEVDLISDRDPEGPLVRLRRIGP